MVLVTARTLISPAADAGIMRRIPALFFVLLFIVPYAAADGMIFIEDHDMWHLQPEQNQVAAIHYENGMENMLISVSPGADFSGDRAVWIFPVPAAPQDVKVDILKEYPRLTGEDTERVFADAVARDTALSVAFATFPLSVICGGALIFSAFIFGMAGNISKSADIQVYDRVEKMGLTTEVVGAENADALNNFLVLRGMTPSAEGKEMLASYIGQDYTFIVTSISNVTEFRSASAQEETYSYRYSGISQVNMIGVFVRFPSDRIYFPLKPTAVYGSREVPVLLYVTGYVTPGLYDGIREETEVTYFREKWYRPTDELRSFFNGHEIFEDLKYTKIRIDAPADRFTEDLWIDPSSPADMVVKDTYLSFPFLAAAIAYVIFSALASLFAGMVAFRRKAADCQTLLLHGLWNCLTIVMLAIRTRQKFPQEEYGKRGPYLLLFYFFFGLLLSVYTLVLAPSLGMLVIAGWAVAVFSPVINLALLLLIPAMFAAVFYHLDAGSLLLACVGSVLISLIAIAPIPVLIWLKRWMDPAPEPALPEGGAP